MRTGRWFLFLRYVTLHIGGTPRREELSYWGGDIKWASAKDVASCRSRYLRETEEAITQKGLKESAAKLLDKDTIVITARGTVGAMCMLPEPMSFNQTCYGLIAKPQVDPEYIYYALKAALKRILTLTYGTVFETITIKSFDKIEVPLPALKIQRAIAHILGSLDDKIELNRKMNETLEAMAKAIFKSWFVDFDPVRANAEGRNPSLPKEIADLFPDEFEDSELGEIPKGWRVDNLGNILELAYGKGLREQDRRPGPIPVFGSNGQIGWHDEKLVDGPCIVVGRKGNPGIVTWSHTDFFPIDTTFYVVPKQKELSLYFLFYALQIHDLPSLGADSAVPGLNRNLVYMSLQIVPKIEVVKMFDTFVMPVYERIFENDRETQILAAIRDALLPKLISGEIRVKDTEKLLESVV